MKLIFIPLFAGAAGILLPSCGNQMPAFEEALFSRGASSGVDADASEALELRSRTIGNRKGGDPDGGAEELRDSQRDVTLGDETGTGSPSAELSVTVIPDGKDLAPWETGGYEGPGDEPGLRACLEAGAWYESIDEHAVANTVFKTVNASNKNGEVVFSDTSASEEPKIVRVELLTKNANKGEMRLLDPNGLYCVKYTAKNLNNFKITTHCNARLVVLDVDLHVTNGFIRNVVGCNQ